MKEIWKCLWQACLLAAVTFFVLVLVVLPLSGCQSTVPIVVKQQQIEMDCTITTDGQGHVVEQRCRTDETGQGDDNLPVEDSGERKVDFPSVGMLN